MKRCPKCGGQEFCVTAHVTQDWIVDENGTFQRTVAECVEVLHQPDNDDVWTCNKCGFDAAGSEFEVK